MVHWLEIMWWICFGILMGYHLLIFRIRPKKPSSPEKSDLPGVSIVIAVKNGSDRLIRNLQAFLSQDYPLYEIVIVDDHSTPEEKRKLESVIADNPKLVLHDNTSLPGKKQALAIGIDRASYPLILCTDADCTPSGTSWISSMAAHSKGRNVVIGFSPYTRSGGVLNLFVRFETVMTAIQYFSWALIGRPYMGVGRNMLYPRQLFLDINPFKDHSTIPYGDDDLWIQQAARSAHVEVNLEKDAFIYSDPPDSWRIWMKQKHRHMSAGHHYSPGHWWKPGLYGISMIGHWFLLPFLLTTIAHSDIPLFLGAGLLIRWVSYIQWTQKLGDRDTRIWYPLVEVAYAVYLAAMGARTILVKKKTWN